MLPPITNKMCFIFLFLFFVIALFYTDWTPGYVVKFSLPHHDPSESFFIIFLNCWNCVVLFAYYFVVLLFFYTPTPSIHSQFPNEGFSKRKCKLNLSWVQRKKNKQKTLEYYWGIDWLKKKKWFFFFFFFFTRLRSRRVVMCLVVVYVCSFVRSFPHTTAGI